MERLKTSVASALLAVAVLFAPLTATGCDQSDKQKLITASGHVYVGLKAASDITHEQHQAGDLADAEALVVYELLDRVGKGVQVFKDRAASLDTITPANKSDLYPLIDAAISDLVTLEAEGVLAIKSEQGRRKFREKVTLARAGLNTVRAFVAAIRGPVRADELPISSLGSPPAR